MSTSNTYDEKLLHWLWKNRYLQKQNLKTNKGASVAVHHPGYANRTDGPDFTNARITIGALKWHGDVEIHWNAADWQRHGHHTDTNYNQVILHVVYQKKDKELYEARSQDGSSPPVLIVKPFLSQSLRYFLDDYTCSNNLPCAGNIHSVPDAIFNAQFADAHTEYFEQKVNDLLSHYKATLPVSEAWLRALSIAIFDVLGISHNRKPMKKLAAALWDEPRESSVETFLQKALNIAGVKPKNKSVPYNWKCKGSRPANHPEVRIRQGCFLLQFLWQQPLQWWLQTSIDDAFQEMIAVVRKQLRIGDNQAGIMYGTVWLPAVYLLGDLVGMQRLKSVADKAWHHHQTTLPQSITKHFNQAGIDSQIYEKKLGTVHQYRTYCKPNRCEQCKVFDYIISA